MSIWSHNTTITYPRFYWLHFTVADAEEKQSLLQERQDSDVEMLQIPSDVASPPTAPPAVPSVYGPSSQPPSFSQSSNTTNVVVGLPLTCMSIIL